MQSTNLDQQLTNAQMRIIGVEFNIQDYAGVIHEMAMFVPNGTGLVIPRQMSIADYSYSRVQYRPLVTFHSTIGDYTIGQNDQNCPW